MKSQIKINNRNIQWFIAKYLLVLITFFGGLTGRAQEANFPIESPPFGYVLGNTIVTDAVKFWGGSNIFKIFMGNSSEFQYGSVTSYSIKTTMNGTAGRGWTWGVIGQTPIAALSN
ncbi:MAG TPA: hypothetical protein DDZ41_09250, partial [Flavobacterium sp.]|nr:hypothetical protein [Flavobacterium sp.]